MSLADSAPREPGRPKTKGRSQAQRDNGRIGTVGQLEGPGGQSLGTLNNGGVAGSSRRFLVNPICTLDRCRSETPLCEAQQQAGKPSRADTGGRQADTGAACPFLPGAGCVAVLRNEGYCLSNCTTPLTGRSSTLSSPDRLRCRQRHNCCLCACGSALGRHLRQVGYQHKSNKVCVKTGQCVVYDRCAGFRVGVLSSGQR